MNLRILSTAACTFVRMDAIDAIAPSTALRMASIEIKVEKSCCWLLGASGTRESSCCSCWRCCFGWSLLSVTTMVSVAVVVGSATANSLSVMRGSIDAARYRMESALGARPKTWHTHVVIHQYDHDMISVTAVFFLSAAMYTFFSFRSWRAKLTVETTGSNAEARNPPGCCWWSC